MTWVCSACNEPKGADGYYWAKGKRSTPCKACKTCHAGKARAEQRVEDFRRNLERLRRFDMALEPAFLDELWGGPGAAQRARRMGFADVVEDGWAWEGGRIRAAWATSGPQEPAEAVTRPGLRG